LEVLAKRGEDPDGIKSRFREGCGQLKNDRVGGYTLKPPEKG